MIKTTIVSYTKSALCTTGRGGTVCKKMVGNEKAAYEKLMEPDEVLRDFVRILQLRLLTPLFTFYFHVASDLAVDQWSEPCL